MMSSMRRVVVVAAVLACMSLFASSRCRSDQSTRSAQPVVAASKNDRRTKVVPQTSGSIAGSVRAGNAPVVDATVCATYSSPDISREETREPVCVRTVNGTYRIDGVPPATYTIVASARTFVSSRIKSFPLAAGEARSGVDLVLQSGGVEFSGSVIDVGGGPIGGAFVRAATWHDDTLAITRTDDRGRYTLWLGPGELRVIAFAEGYAPTEHEVRAPGVVDLFLTPESTLSGTVIDARTHEPVANVHVETSYPSNEDITDEHGRFRITRLAPGRYTLSARGRGYRAPGQPSITLGLAQQGEVTLFAVSGLRIAGHVVLSNGAPCTKGTVRTRSSHEIQPDGSVALDGLAPGEHHVTVACEGYQRLKEKITIENDIENKTWTVQPGHRLVGRALTRGRVAVGSIAVAIVGSSDNAFRGYANTDRDGRFTFDGIPADTYALQLSDSTIDPTRISVEVRQPVVEHDLILQKGDASIRGLLVDAKGKPIGNIRLHALATETEETTLSDGAGAFVFEHLSAGSYELSAFDRVRFQDLRSADGATGVLARVTVGEDQHVEVKLVAETADGTLRGSVVDKRGKPIADAFVMALRSDPRARCAWLSWAYDDARRMTAHDGTFEIANLTPGTYCLRAYRIGAGDGFVEDVALGSSSRITLRDTTRIAGRAHLSDGKSPEEMTIRLMGPTSRRESFFRSDGRFQFDGLEAGDYELSVTTSSAAGIARITIAEGQARDDVDIALQPTTTVFGRLVDRSTKQPLVASVSVTHRSSVSRYSGAAFHQQTDAQGRFKLERVPTGPIVLTVWDSHSKWHTENPRMDFGRVLPNQPAVDLGDILVVQPRAGIDSGEQGEVGYSLVANPASWFVDRFEIASIEPAGPAARSGLRVGDVITSVDGIDVRGENAGFYHALTSAPPGTKLLLGLARDTTVEVVLAKP